MNQLGRVFFNSGVNPNDPQEWAQFLSDLNVQLDGLVGAANTGMLVYDSVAAGVSFPTTTITITGLTGLTAGGYRVEMRLVNTSGVAMAYRLFYNNDTTDANYDYYGSTSGNYAGLYNIAGINSDNELVINLDVSVFPYDSTHIMVVAEGLGQLRTVSSRTPLANQLHINHSYRIAILNSTDLNRFDISTTTSNGICLYSRVRIFKSI